MHCDDEVSDEKGLYAWARFWEGVVFECIEKRVPDSPLL
jgi:hypothetical protein